MRRIIIKDPPADHVTEVLYNAMKFVAEPDVTLYADSDASWQFTIDEVEVRVIDEAETEWLLPRGERVEFLTVAAEVRLQPLSCT